MHKMRRTDREINQEEALDILKRAEYGVLSTISADNLPYGFPIHFCILSNSIYIHCANEGHKIDNFTLNKNVSFCVVGDTCVLPEKFATQYESAIVSGSISEVFESEKLKALKGLLQKYSKNHFEKGLKYIAAAKEKTRVFKIVIETISGKARR